jgi:hypothetical protein
VASVGGFVIAEAAAGKQPPPSSIYFAESPVDATQTKDITVMCPSGMRATGGGGFVFTGSAPTFLQRSTPVSVGGGDAVNSGDIAAGWRVTGMFDLQVYNTWGLRAYVVCT